MKPKVNEWFYHITPNGKYLRRIRVINGPFFEWLWGWAELSQLKPNTGTKTKVKFVLNQS